MLPEVGTRFSLRGKLKENKWERKLKVQRRKWAFKWLTGRRFAATCQQVNVDCKTERITTSSSFWLAALCSSVCPGAWNDLSSEEASLRVTRQRTDAVLLSFAAMVWCRGVGGCSARRKMETTFVFCFTFEWWSLSWPWAEKTRLIWYRLTFIHSSHTFTDAAEQKKASDTWMLRWDGTSVHVLLSSGWSSSDRKFLNEIRAEGVGAVRPSIPLLTCFRAGAYPSWGRWEVGYTWTGDQSVTAITGNLWIYEENEIQTMNLETKFG